MRDPWVWSPHTFADSACDPPKEVFITPRDRAIFEQLSAEPDYLRRCSTPPGSRLNAITPDTEQGHSPPSSFRPDSQSSCLNAWLNAVTPDSEAYLPQSSFRSDRQAFGLKAATSTSPTQSGESPAISRCGTPRGESASRQSDAPLSGHCTPQGVDWTDADEEVRGISSQHPSLLSRPVPLEIVTSRLLRCLEAHDVSRNARASPALYKGALANVRHRKLTNAMEIRSPSPREAQRRRGPSVPSEAGKAVLTVLRQLFQGHEFQDRDVQVSVARPAAATPAEVVDLELVDCAKAFPRFEAVMLGRHAPRSRCCQSPVLTFFDVEYGVAVMCMKTACTQPALLLQSLPKAKRLQIWGRWIHLNAGLLPRHTPPPANVAMSAFLEPSREDSEQNPTSKTSASLFSNTISLMDDINVAWSQVLPPAAGQAEHELFENKASVACQMEQQDQDLQQRSAEKKVTRVLYTSEPNWTVENEKEGAGTAALYAETRRTEQHEKEEVGMALWGEEASLTEHHAKEGASSAKLQEDKDAASQTAHGEEDEASRAVEQDAASQAEREEDNVTSAEEWDSVSETARQEEACEEVARQSVSQEEDEARYVEQRGTSQVEQEVGMASLAEQEGAVGQAKRQQEACEGSAIQVELQEGASLVEMRMDELPEGACQADHKEDADAEDEPVSPLLPAPPWLFGQGDPSSSPGSSQLPGWPRRPASPRHHNTRRLDPMAFSTGGSSASDGVSAMSSSSASEEAAVQAEQRVEAVAAVSLHHAGQFEGLLLRAPSPWARSPPGRKQRPQKRDDAQPFHHISIEDIPEARAPSPRQLESQAGTWRGQRRLEPRPSLTGRDEDSDSNSVASCATPPWACVGSGAAGVRGLQGFARRPAQGPQGKSSKWKQGPRWRYLPPRHQRAGHAFALPSALRL